MDVISVCVKDSPLLIEKSNKMKKASFLNLNLLSPLARPVSNSAWIILDDNISIKNSKIKKFLVEI